MAGEKRVVARNRKARYNYHIEDTLEAGIVLTGTEVKSCRQGKLSLAEAHAIVDGNEVWIHGLHIAEYDHGSRYNHEETRPRKLLLRRHQINYLYGRTRERGYTLVPLQAYFTHGLMKIEIGLAKGKRQYDKRQDIKRRDAQRKMRQAIKEQRYR